MIIPIMIGGEIYDLKFYVVPNLPHKIILGIDTLMHRKLRFYSRTRNY